MKIHEINHLITKHNFESVQVYEWIPNKYCSKSMSVLNVYLCVYMNITISNVAKYMNQFPNKYCNKSTTVMNVHLCVY